MKNAMDRKMMDSMSNQREGEQGFILVAALVCLAVLSIIGIAGMQNSNIEKEIAHNINTIEKTFYGADGATEAGIEMIEFNLSCPLGFKGLAGFGLTDTDPTTVYRIEGVEIADSRFAFDENINGIPWDPTVDDLCSGPGDGDCLSPATPIELAFLPSDGARSIRIPGDWNIVVANRDNPRPPAPNMAHSNIAIFGNTGLGTGSGLQMGAGYEGKGKGAAGGGGVIDYTIYAQRYGLGQTESVVRLGWKHLIGMEGECRPYTN